MLQEFRDFINRGNFVDIAVAFVVGAAFGTVVSALTGRIVTPLIGMLFGAPDWENLGTFGDVSPGADGQLGTPDDVPAGSVGAFLEAAVNFLIVAFAMFLVVKAYNTFKVRTADPAVEEETTEPEDIVLLREIRDSLRSE